MEKIKTMLEGVGLKINEIVLLAQGHDSKVFLCDNLYIVKVPKRESVMHSQALEFLLYDFLSDFDLSCEIPRALCKNTDFNVMTYIKGEHLTYDTYHLLSEKEQDHLAYEEAQFLMRLHAIEVDGLDALFASVMQNKRLEYINDRDQLVEILKSKNYFTPFIQEIVNQVYTGLLNMDFLYEYTPCIVHNDFSADNMVFRNNGLVGVIDFGDFVIGDPDNDFLCLLDRSEDDFGKEFGRKVLRYYGHKNPDLAEKKANIHDSYWPIQQILLGGSRKDNWLMDKGLRELPEINIHDFIC